MMGRDVDNDAFDTGACDNLNFILKEDPKAMIVVSSSWRKGRSLEELKKILQDNGIDPNRVIGKTHDSLRDIRGREISKWILDNIKDIEGYVILDDDSDMLPKQQNNFIKIGRQEGLTMLDAIQALKILRSPF